MVGQLNRAGTRTLSQLLEASVAGQRPFDEPLQILTWPCSGCPGGRRHEVWQDIAMPVVGMAADAVGDAALPGWGCRSGRSAERLFLSPRTVDSRLCRISPKLSITSRSELSSRIDVN
ncbi:MAG TPA: hypothetical protein VGR06_29625 [Actinophytocola sp.]|uniref:hypothetical protein n=1 Tax=Actinophytocola sp. TaxID=1872138 RepID=UPI002DFC276C|nr:hypothetical protein [Actinophytocola sp.]